MAENLGEAQLRLTVDLAAFQQSLRDARALITSELANVTTLGGSGRRTQSQNPQQTVRRAIGGAREGIRALEIAQERRFRLARRIDSLESRGVDVARLRANLGRLTDTQIRRQFGSFRQVSQELARQVTLEERRLQTQRRIERAARQQATVGAQMGGARESIFALERAQDRRFRVSQRIGRLEDRGADVSRLRAKLGELTTSYAQRQFGTARQLSRELERQVSLTEARLRRERDLQQITSRSARLGGARSPIRGSAQTPGSPAFLDAQRRAEDAGLRRAIALGGAREPIRGRTNLPGSPLFEEARAREAARLAREQAAAERTRRLEAARAAREQARLDRQAAQQRRAEIQEGLRVGRLNTSPISGRTLDGIALPGSPNARGRDFNLRSSWTKFLTQLQEVKRDIDAASVETSKRRRGPTSPISGRLINGRVIPGSPADIQRQLTAATARGPALPVSGRLINGQVVPGSPADLARRSRTAGGVGSSAFQEAIGNAVIGGAFPLLFGQGLGASVGGGLGGLVGGGLGGNFGFGLSLVGTALGSAVDALNQRFKDLATALQTPIQSFDKLKEASLLASKAQEGYVQALIDSGKTAQAAQIIQQEAARTIDPATALLVAGSTDELSRAFSDVQDKISNLTSGAGASFLGWLTDVIKATSRVLPGPTALTGPEAVNAGKGLQSFGNSLSSFGTGFLSVPGVGIPVTALGQGISQFGRQKEAVATDQNVLSANQQIQATYEQQKVTQDQINAAKAAGLTKTAELLALTNQFQTAQLTAAQQELQIQAQLAANRISKAEADRQLANSESARRVTVEVLVAKQQEAAAIALTELQSAKALVGLKGEARTIAQQQLKQEAAINDYLQTRAAYETRKNSGLAGPEELAALRAAAEEAGTKLTTSMVTGAEAIKNAAESAKKNFDDAAKALQTTAEGNYKFLTKQAQAQVLGQARQDIARGVQGGNIDPKFLNARKPEDVLAAANASRSQTQALENFNQAASDYSNAIKQSNQTLGSVSNQLPEVANKIVALQGSLDGLAQKDWSVNVSVTGDSAANVRVD